MLLLLGKNQSTTAVLYTLFVLDDTEVTSRTIRK